MPPKSFQHDLGQLAKAARPGTIGIAIRDLRSGRSWGVNAQRAFPMMSVFKAPLGAAALSLADRRILSLDQDVVVRRADLMTAGVSQIARTFHGDEETFSVRELLGAAVSHSDNTAADVLLKLVGGPAVVTSFLRAHGIGDMRIDRGEDEIAQEFGEWSPHPADGGETPKRRLARLRRGYAEYLKDPRDRTTPEAAVAFLMKLWRGQLLSPPSTRLLLELLYRQTVPDRLRAGFPAGVRFADKCGTSYTIDGMTAAFNDIGILTWPDGHTILVAVFLTASRAPQSRMNALFKGIAQAVVTDLGP